MLVIFTGSAAAAPANSAPAASVASFSILIVVPPRSCLSG
jgi:hypothetical protein